MDTQRHVCSTSIISGKEGLAPFEQAGFVYRRLQTHEIDTAQLAQEIGLSNLRLSGALHGFQLATDDAVTRAANQGDLRALRRTIGHPDPQEAESTPQSH